MPQARGFFLSSTPLVPFLGAEIPVEPPVDPSDLLLAGVWADTAVWIDSSIWNDGGADSGILASGAWNDNAAWSDSGEWKDAA